MHAHSLNTQRNAQPEVCGVGDNDNGNEGWPVPNFFDQLLSLSLC